MPDPPPVALRTYTAIRMGVVVVIASLGWAVYREIANAEQHCVQRSLSAYYYTPVRPVFVGALLVIGFAMVVMWGMTFLEDAALNLAGLLLTVVALNPTLDATYCSVATGVAGGPVPADETKAVKDAELIKANAETISRGMFSLLVVLTVLLVLVAVTGLVVYRRAEEDRRPTEKAVKGYVVTWVLAALAVLVYWLLLWDANNRPLPWKGNHDSVKESSVFYHQVHSWSANLSVLLILVAAVFAAREKLPRGESPPVPWWKVWRWKIWKQDPSTWMIWTNWWAISYGICASAMATAIVGLKGGDAIGLYSGWWDEHATFLVEAILIFLIGAFWFIQTIDRRSTGAPRY
jgi:hypothetical protein